MDALNSPDVPLYLDTSVLWRAQLIADLRTAYPERHLCVPAVAHFERVRQLRVKWHDNFDPREIQAFIETHDLILVPLDRQTADLIAEMARVVEQRGYNWIPVWPQQPTDVARHPCGQRCRLGDYAIAATAKVRGGILLSDDEALQIMADQNPDLFPLTLSSAQIEQSLNEICESRGVS